MSTPRTVFIVSDGTGITAETVAQSLLAQFPQIRFRLVRMPFVTTPDLVQQCLDRIALVYRHDGVRPIVISTLIDPALAAMLHSTAAMVINLFESFIAPLEAEFDMKASHALGQFHGRADSSDYAARIDAINYTMAHDDGVSNIELDQADVILIGVSRSGKTPTSLYLALQFGLKVANYPLIPEDFERRRLPDALTLYRSKLFGLSIAPQRLASIRRERRPGSRYAALDNCIWEVEEAQRLMQHEGIRWLDSTTKSIEEISAALIQIVKAEGRLY